MSMDGLCLAYCVTREKAEKQQGEESIMKLFSVSLPSFLHARRHLGNNLEAAVIHHSEALQLSQDGDIRPDVSSFSLLLEYM